MSLDDDADAPGNSCCPATAATSGTTGTSEDFPRELRVSA
jgi:hypothetical protein